MVYKETNGNITTIYSVEIYDRELVQQALEDIVSKTGYEIYGHHILPCDLLRSSVETELRKTLPDDITPMYTDINNDIITDPSKVLDRKFLPSGLAVISSNKKVVPELAYIVHDLLEGKRHVAKRLIEYRNNEELLDIDTRIDIADETIDAYNMGYSGSNIKTFKRIYSKQYDLREMKKNGEVFDTEELLSLYSKILSVCDIQPMCQIITRGNLSSTNILVYNFKPLPLLDFIYNEHDFQKVRDSI